MPYLEGDNQIIVGRSINIPLKPLANTRVQPGYMTGLHTTTDSAPR